MRVVGQKSWSVTQCQGTREALGHQMKYLLVTTNPCLVSESRICHSCNFQVEKVSLVKSRGHFPEVGFLSRPPGSLSYPEDEMQPPSPFRQGSVRGVVCNQNKLPRLQSGSRSGTKAPAQGSLAFFLPIRTNFQWAFSEDSHTFHLGKLSCAFHGISKAPPSFSPCGTLE